MSAGDLPEIAEKELRFCEEYLHCRVAVQAALKAGLSENYINAAKQGSEFLKKPQIKAWLKFLKLQQAKSIKTSVPRVLREYAVVAFGDIEDFMIDEQSGRIVTAPGLPIARRRVVKKKKLTKVITSRTRGDVTTTTTTITVDLGMHDKLHAHTQLMKFLKDLPPNAEADDDIGNDELLQLVAHIASNPRPDHGGGG